MRHFICKEKNIVFLITFLFLFIGLFPTVSFYLRTPKNSDYTFLHNSVSDYPYYISFIRQGLEGKTKTVDQFTTELQTPALLHIFYLVLGRIGSIFSLSAIQIYFFARAFLGLLFLLSGYAFISYFLKRKWERILSFIFFIASGSFPKIIFGDKGIEIGQYLFWWTETDPLRRITFIPHFLMGHIGLTLGLILLIYLFKTHHPLYLIAGIIIGLITGLSHPPSLGMIYYILGVFFIAKVFFSFLYDRVSFVGLGKQILLFVVYVTLTISSLIYILETTSKIFPWTLMKTQESLFYAIDMIEYLLSLGPLSIMGILGILVVLRERKNLTDEKNSYLLIPIFWILIDIAMIPFSRFIAFTPLPFKIPTFANIRFLSIAVQLPLSIFAVYFLKVLKKNYGKKIFWGTIGIYILLTVTIYPQSIKSQLNDFSSARQFVYVSKNLVKAFEYLDKNTKEDEAVLTTADNSLLLPLFARNKVFFGQAIYTYNNEYKKKIVSQFFSSFEKNAAYKFLKEGNVHHLLIDNLYTNEIISKYPFLDKIYETEGVYIYKVI